MPGANVLELFLRGNKCGAEMTRNTRETFIALQERIE